MSDLQSAFWGMVINNYDETDLALVRQGYPDFIRQIVYTLEKGEETGTPHIQAYIRLYRQQRLSYVKKLFPRGNFKCLTCDAYKLNAQAYAQKLDSTAESPAVISNNPFPDPVQELISVTEEVFATCYTDRTFRTATDETFLFKAGQVERRRVTLKPGLAKFYVSATYRNIKKEFWRSIAQHVANQREVEDTHTHTHTDEKFSVAEDIENGDDSSEVGGEGEESETEGSETDSEGDQDSSGEETE